MNQSRAHFQLPMTSNRTLAVASVESWSDLFWFDCIKSVTFLVCFVEVHRMASSNSHLNILEIFDFLLHHSQKDLKPDYPRIIFNRFTDECMRPCVISLQIFNSLFGIVFPWIWYRRFCFRFSRPSLHFRVPWARLPNYEYSFEWSLWSSNIPCIRKLFQTMHAKNRSSQQDQR